MKTTQRNSGCPENQTVAINAQSLISITLILFPTVILSSCRTAVSRITGGEKGFKKKRGTHEGEGWKGGGTGQGKEREEVRKGRAKTGGLGVVVGTR